MSESKPLDAYISYLKGVDNIKKGLIHQALSIFQEILRSEPEYVYGLFGLGCAYASQGLMKQAVEQWSRAVELDPDIGEAHYALAWAYYSSEEHELARKHFKLGWDSDASYDSVRELIERFPESISH